MTPIAPPVFDNGNKAEANFCVNVRHLCDARNISQKKLGVAIGRYEAFVGRCLVGQSHPTIPDVVRVAEYFKIDLLDLLNYHVPRDLATYPSYSWDREELIWIRHEVE